MTNQHNKILYKIHLKNKWTKQNFFGLINNIEEETVIKQNEQVDKLVITKEMMDKLERFKFNAQKQLTDRRSALNIHTSKVCGYCKKPGHTTDECRRKAYHEKRNNSYNANDTTNSNNKDRIITKIRKLEGALGQRIQGKIADLQSLFKLKHKI